MGISDFGFIADACSACNKKAIRTEWLFETRKSKETPIYVRDNDDIEVFESLSPAAIGVVEKTRDNALFLSTCDQNNVKIAKEIAAWFNQFNSISGLTHERLRGVMLGMSEEIMQKKTLR